MVKPNEKELIQIIVSDILLLQDITQIGNMAKDDYDPKQSVTIGNRLNKNLKLLLKTEEGIAELNKLCEDDNKYISFIAARYLYPVYPKRCMKIMISYKQNITDDFELMTVNNIIDGINKKLNVFVDLFKKLYNVDDLSVLNRESK